ncbi:MAG: LolA-related protein [Betaproteobacteria bacterium]
MRWLAFALTLMQATSAAAADFALADLMRLLARVPSAETGFIETRRLALLESPLVLKGRLAYTRPDRLEKHVLAPYDERTVVAGNTVTIENRTRNRTTTLSRASAPAVLTLVESLRATLSGDVAALERHYAVRLSGTAQDWTIALTPREPGIAALVVAVRLAGRGSQLLRLEVEEAGGDSSVMVMEGRP